MNNLPVKLAKSLHEIKEKLSDHYLILIEKEYYEHLMDVEKEILLLKKKIDESLSVISDLELCIESIENRISNLSFNYHIS